MEAGLKFGVYCRTLPIILNIQPLRRWICRLTLNDFMKTIILSSLLFATTLYGQGTLLLDQYSSLDETVFPGIRTGSIHGVGQSFTPTLSGIDFIRLSIADCSIGFFN